MWMASRLGHVGAVIGDVDIVLVGERGALRLDLDRVAEAVEHDGGAGSCASARAMPRPMPLVEPVTMAVRPSSGRRPVWSVGFGFDDVEHFGLHCVGRIRSRCLERDM